MSKKNSVHPLVNIYSSKLLFDKLEDRNQKRIAQIMKRKKALLSKNKNRNNITKDKSSEEMITPSTQEVSLTNTLFDFSKSRIKEENLKKNVNLSSNSRTIDKLLSSFKYKDINAPAKIENSFNILDEDLLEKEINISNLNDNDYIKDSDKKSEKDKIKNKNKKNEPANKDTSNSKDKNKNIFILINKKEKKNSKDKINNNIYQRNRYAIEYLSSSLDSFVQLKNKLVTKARYNKNYFTLSYLQALSLDFNNRKNVNDSNYNYAVNDIIKEEKENESSSPKPEIKKRVGYTNTVVGLKKSINKKRTNNINVKKLSNKSFCKTTNHNYIEDKINDVQKYAFNTKALANNFKLKMPKVELSMEIKSKGKIYEHKEAKSKNEIIKSKNLININTPKLLLFMNEDGNSKEKLKKEKKRVKTIARKKY